MTPYQKRPCPLTQRLAEDMLIRNMDQATIDAYTHHARRFADFNLEEFEVWDVADQRQSKCY